MTGDRRGSLGGSDMAAVLGLDRRRSPLTVYLEKTGQAEPDDPSEAMYWGTVFEQPVARRYAEVTGRRLRRVNRVLIHPDYPWATAHVDRMVIGEKRGLEVKCSSRDDWGEPGTDQIPEIFLPQVQHYLAITGAEAWDVAVLLWGGHGPPELRIYVVLPDQAFADLMYGIAAAFWIDNVLRGMPPPPRLGADCKQLWPRDDGGVVVCDAAGEAAVEALREAERERDAAEARYDAAKVAVKAMMGTAATLRGIDGRVRATWRSQTSRQLCPALVRDMLSPEEIERCKTETSKRVFLLKA